MMLNLEILLIAGVVTFYVLDSALLLYFDELVFVRNGQRWRASPGGAEWRGRFLFLPNPMTPWQIILRGSWLAPPRRVRGNCGRQLLKLQLVLRPLQIGVTILAVLLLLVLPILLWRYPNPLTMLGLLIAVYANSLQLAILIWLRRESLHLEKRAAAWLMFDCVACPPHAVNIVRKLSLLQPLPMDTLSIAEQHVEGIAKQRLVATLSNRIAIAHTEGVDAARDKRLETVRHRIEGAAT